MLTPPPPTGIALRPDGTLNLAFVANALGFYANHIEGRPQRGDYFPADLRLAAQMLVAGPPPPASHLEGDPANKAEAILRIVRKMIAAENAHAEKPLNSGDRLELDFLLGELIRFTTTDVDEALRIVRRRRATPSPQTNVAVLETALAKINDIRNSIIGCQKINWSEHIYPLVAALNEAGIEGQSYPEAREYVGTMLERTLAAENEVDGLRAALKLAIDHIEHISAHFSNLGTGYSFESLGEDMPGIKAALASTEGGQ